MVDPSEALCETSLSIGSEASLDVIMCCGMNGSSSSCHPVAGTPWIAPVSSTTGAPLDGEIDSWNVGPMDALASSLAIGAGVRSPPAEPAVAREATCNGRVDGAASVGLPGASECAREAACSRFRSPSISSSEQAVGKVSLARARRSILPRWS